MEQEVIALPENARQVGEKGLEVAFNALLVLLVDEGEDDITGLECIRPLFHFERVFHLRASEV